jgi:hypothetical protein
MPTVSELEAELRATRRELASARRALQDQRVSQRRPHSSEDTVRALSVVLHHSIPAALQELRAEQRRLIRDLGYTRTVLRTAKLKYSTLRYNVWQLTQRFFAGHEEPRKVLEEILGETLDSEDDREWEDGGWVE